jgi:hypothetical protein
MRSRSLYLRGSARLATCSFFLRLKPFEVVFDLGRVQGVSSVVVGPAMLCPYCALEVVLQTVPDLFSRAILCCEKSKQEGSFE